MHFYGWKRGLKTGIYYLRTRPSAQAIQFTIDDKTLKRESDFPTRMQCRFGQLSMIDGAWLTILQRPRQTQLLPSLRRPPLPHLSTRSRLL